ncbi:MAG: ribosome rescue protein RqcH [Candidatus Methanomethylophilaceae archaeon]
MKKEMSAFDVRSMAEELGSLEGSFLDKVFHWGKGNFLARVNVQGEGKKEVFFKDRCWLFMPERKPETPAMPSNFAAHLRKNISNTRIGSVRQIGFDRIIVMELGRQDASYQLVFELFGGGNLLLVKDGQIINCLVQKNWRQRSIRPGETYVMPEPRFDPFLASQDDFMALLSSSQSDLVRTLATTVNLGGQYAEEVCHRAGIVKNTPVRNLDPEQQLRAWEEMQGLIRDFQGRKTAVLYTQDGEPADATPFPLHTLEAWDPQEQPSFSAALEGFLSLIHEEEEESYQDPEVLRLQRRMDMQQQTIDEFRQEAEDLRLRADAVYADYGRTDELLKVLQEQSPKLGWEKLREGALRIPFVKDIDPSKSLVVAELGGKQVSLDYRLGLDANASRIYQKGKDLNEKALRAELALKSSQEQMERRRKGLEKARVSRSRSQPTKQFWFERYKWFITSGGRLVLAGRDARTNDQVVKKHLKEDDYYVHADVHGAPSVILKKGPGATEEELREAAVFAVSQSKAWVSRFMEGSAYWVTADQVSKTPQAGEFVPKGAFIIRGKRNYQYHLPLELAVGEVLHEGARKVMCAPVDVIRKASEKYVVIGPGRNKKNDRHAAGIARAFDVPEEEVSRILPPGDVELREVKNLDLEKE